MFECTHFVQKTSSWPYITFPSVFSSFPYFRTSIIGCASLCWAHSIFGYLRDIEITKFCDIVYEKDIRALDVPMYDFIFVKNFQSLKNFECNLPYKCFLKPFLVIELVLCVNFAFQITTIGILHHNTKRLSLEVEKWPFVLDDVRDVNGSKKPDFIEGVFLLFLGETGHGDGFDSIDILVSFFADKLNIAETAGAYFFENLEILDRKLFRVHYI